MLFSLLPTTALATGDYPAANVVSVDNGKNFAAGKLYFRNGEEDCSSDSTNFNAYYEPTTGTLTLNGYNGKGISVGGALRADITVKLVGTNTINGGVLESSMGGDITITSDSKGTLSITHTLNGGNDAIGIKTGLASSYTTGNVTIKGDAKVTINMTHNGTNGYDNAYGIYAKENITISGDASVDITCATPNNTTGGYNCNGLVASKKVIIDTNGEIKIDVTKAGGDDAYSYGIFPTNGATLTKVGNMEVKWKKDASVSWNSGGTITGSDNFSDTDHAINVDKPNCYASYRFGTPRTVMVENGTLTGPGVLNAESSGKFLENDTVSITPYERKGKSGETIPFKGWTSSNVTLNSPATTENNSFTVPNKNVTVTAKHNPFVVAPTFTPTGLTNTTGTLTFKTVVRLGDGTECFYLVKDGEQNDDSKYISFRPDNSPSTSPYEYSYETRSLPGVNQVDEGDYYVVEYLNGAYYLSEKFTVNYTAPAKTLSSIAVTTAPTKTTYTAGENFDPAGMVVTATYSDSSTAAVTSYTVTDGNNLTAGKSTVTISYTEGGLTKTCTQVITVNAAPTEYTITFNGNGGTPSEGTMTTVGSKLTSLPTATHSGSYSFVGWYTAASGGTQITTAYEFSADTTVYAHWTYTGGGSFSSYVPTVQKPEITIIGSGKADLSADGRTATITAAAGHELVSVVLNGKEMGKVEKLTGLKTGDKATITFRAKTDGKAEMDKMIAQKASKLTLMARSKKTAKLNIKVVVKGDLKAITDAGYTVKYKFYRSTKKSAGYKAVLTKKAPTYYNTYGKKGTMYYYKARVMIYDKDGNFVAQTALKQCKYANRLWTK